MDENLKVVVNGVSALHSLQILRPTMTDQPPRVDLRDDCLDRSSVIKALHVNVVEPAAHVNGVRL